MAQLNGSDIEVTKENGTFLFTAGDVEFQSTLTDLEKQYIHEGSNWISKLGREKYLKELHAEGKTLDEVRGNNS